MRLGTPLGSGEGACPAKPGAELEPQVGGVAEAAGANPALAVAGPNGGLPAGHTWNQDQLYCTQPAPSAPSSEGFGSNWETQDAGLRGATATRPDVNVFKVEASMWW